MKKVPQLTDFTHRLCFADIDGLTVGVPLNFTMTFYTDCGNDHKSYRCNNGICDEGLIIDGETVLVVFNRPVFSGGCLHMDLHYKLPDSTYADGWFHKRATSKLNIEIISKGTSVEDDSIDKIVLEYSKNVHTEVSVVGLDYTLGGEGAIPGEFWFGSDGVSKKQVYYTTIRGTIPNVIEKNGATWLRLSHSITHVMPSGTDQIRYISGGINDIRPMDATYQDKDIYNLEPGSKGILLYFQNATPSFFVGKSYHITVHYTKK